MVTTLHLVAAVIVFPQHESVKTVEIRNDCNHHRPWDADPYRQRRLWRNPGGTECFLESRTQSWPFPAGSCTHRWPRPGDDVGVLDDRIAGRQRWPVGSGYILKSVLPMAYVLMWGLDLVISLGLLSFLFAAIYKILLNKSI